ncbi:MAG TPA: cytochrome c-type biogenesis protein CcmH [Myxococcales bacterium]|nr:cytochrome c-type biogenesis protein CcmH [Myxococcales bacterium]
MTRVALLSIALLSLPAMSAPAEPPPSASRAGAPRGAPLSGPELDARTDEVGALLRCPVCQGLSVSDSPSSMARNMKAEVRDKLAAGYDQEQILADFEHSYGEFVRLKPTLRGVNWLVWFGPLLALIAGAALIASKLKRSGSGPDALPAPRSAAAVDVPDRGTLPDDPRLAEAMRRVRELAYGWPGGVPPKAGASA